MAGGNGKDKDFEEVLADITNIFSGRKGGTGGGGHRGGGGGGNGPEFNAPNLKTIAVIALVAIVTLGFLNSFYTVEEHEEAVVTRFGLFSGTNGPGAHLKLPIIDQVYKVSKGFMKQEFGFRKDTRWRAKGRLTEESLMLTGDLNLADVEWVVQYRILDSKKNLFNVREIEKTIRDVSMSVMRRSVGDRLVGEVLTTARTQVAEEVRERMQQTLDEYDIGLKVILVELQSVDPPDEVKPSYNAVTAAKQEQEQDINQAERGYNKVIPKARGEAEKEIANAEAFAIDVVNRAKGEADYFSSILSAYREAPSITKKRIYIETMEKVIQGSDSFMVVDDKVSGLLPVFTDGKNPVPVKK